MTSVYRPVTAIAMDPLFVPRFFPQELHDALAEVTVLIPRIVTDISNPADRRDLASVEVLLTGWGCPPITADALADMPRLAAIVHSGGSVKHHVTDACWARNIVVSSQAALNAVPVADFAVAITVLANKRTLPLINEYRLERRWIDPGGLFPDMGNHGKRIGIIGASTIGRLVLDRLAAFDLDLAIYDPYLPTQDARKWDAQVVDLEELFATSNVVSIHAPVTSETTNMVGSRLLSLLPDGATLINTARGALLDHDALFAEVSRRDLYAVLDVTEPEPLPAQSPLWDHPNVILTPHIAGSLGTEIAMLGQASVEEVVRYSRGEPFRYPVDPVRIALSA